MFQMEKYWKNKQPSVLPAVSPTDITSGDAGSASLLSDYDRYRRTILSTKQRAREGWEAELRRYEKEMPADVSPETDIIKWWQVCSYIYPTRYIFSKYSHGTLLGSLQRVPHSCQHCAGYPPYPSLFSTLRTTLLSSKGNRR